jgi:two-component system, LuxR family, response regulator FixJ
LTGRATIYVIDDDDAVRDSLRMLLEAEGYTVVDFASGAQFLRVERTDGHSCLLLDMHMPGMSGVELLERVRGNHPLMPMVVMTGRPGPATARAAASAGAPVLEKPFMGRELLDAIERSLSAGSVR